MATNKLALIRYKTIDDCLRNRHRKWTLDDLIEKVADALYEYEGITNGISRRTIQADIQLMRSDKLGYNAPIVVTDRKFYSYSDREYSISNSPVTTADMDKMKEVVDVLKHLNGFSYFDEMSDLIARLENSLHRTGKTERSTIQLEGNKLLRGLDWIPVIHRAIRQKIPLLIGYQSFKSPYPTESVYYPYLLKEYRNRWFMICKPRKGKMLLTLALDRMKEIQEMAKDGFVEYDGVDFERYYSDVIGVTKTEKDRGQRVILEVDAYNADYVLTKPIHSSQQLLDRKENGSILIRLDVVLNFELEREILGFGECIKVLSPRNLQTRIARRINKMNELYNLTDKS